MNKYIIGLDLGINNVGWSIVDKEKKIVEKSGVRLFNASNSAQDRREARGVRRRQKRKNNRINSMLDLFRENSFPSKNTIDSELLSKRVKGLYHKLEKSDIVNISCYFASHRGYIPFGDEERKLIDLNGMFPCEYYQELLRTDGKYRALEQVVDNSDLIREFIQIIECQKQYYPELANMKDALIDIITRKRKFWEGPGSKKSRTNYGRFKTEKYKEEHGIIDDLEFLYDDLIGKCSIFVGEKSAPVGNYYYEIFNLLNDFINTSVVSIDNLFDQKAVELDNRTGYYKLTSDSLDKIIDFCVNNPKLSYDNIYRKLFGLKKEDISGYRIDKNYKPLFSTMNFYRIVLSAFDGFDDTWIRDIRQYNEIIRILAISPGIAETKKMINSPDSIITYKFSDAEYEILKSVSIKLKNNGAFKYGSLSQKALEVAIRDMKSTCMNFMQVSRKFDYQKEFRNNFIDKYRETEGMLLIDSQFVDEIIASPQVKKSLRQAIKIINSIIIEKGCYPDVIAVESTHEMNGKERKKQIDKEQKINESLRKKAEEVILNNFDDKYLTDKNIEKVMLYDEVDGRCPYCNIPFKDGLNSVISGNIEVEHILPVSKSFNDSFNNKTLACRNCNSAKGNNSPYLWMGVEKFDDFSDRIKKFRISNEKKINFLETRDLDKYNTRFFNRNLRDVAYATTELINQINIFNSYLKYKIPNVNKIKTLSTPGQLTSKIRNGLNLSKNRDDGIFHHAVDASIAAGIALDDDLGRLLLESQNDSDFWIKKKYLTDKIDKQLVNYNSSVIDKDLRNIKSDKDINISTQVIKDPNKSIANANIYKYLRFGDEFKKVNQISDIYAEDLMKDKTLPKLFDDSDNNTLMIRDNNPKMYEKLKQIYNEYQDKGPSKNPFINYCLEVNDISKEDFDYKRHGIKQENGPVIKRLRYYSNCSVPSLLNKKNMVLKSNTFIGLDSVAQSYTKVYWDNEKELFIFLPIYVTSLDLNTGKLNKEDKTYQEFYNLYLKEKKFTFIVDLYNGNYIEVKKKDNTIKGFISGYDKFGNRVRLKSGESFSVSDKLLVVYDVDYLGNKKIRLTWPSK